MNASTKSTAPGVSVFTSTTSVTGSTTVMMPRSIDARSQTAANEQLEKAVYSHLQAVRALGRVTANTADIARALGVTTIAVDNTLAALAKKGVKITE